MLDLNVWGLKSKLRGPDFEQLIEQYDNVCLSKAKLRDVDNVDIPGCEISKSNQNTAKGEAGGIS